MISSSYIYTNKDSGVIEIPVMSTLIKIHKLGLVYLVKCLFSLRFWQATENVSFQNPVFKSADLNLKQALLQNTSKTD